MGQVGATSATSAASPQPAPIKLPRVRYDDRVTIEGQVYAFCRSAAGSFNDLAVEVETSLAISGKLGRDSDQLEICLHPLDEIGESHLYDYRYFQFLVVAKALGAEIPESAAEVGK